MKPGLEESLRFLRLAEKDLKAFMAMKNHPDIAFEIACFHAQQSVEKSLKAIMFLKKIEFRRTHDLEELAAILNRNGLVLPLPTEQISRLNPFAVTVRYDDEDIPTITLAEVHYIAESLWNWANVYIKEAKN